MFSAWKPKVSQRCVLPASGPEGLTSFSRVLHVFMLQLPRQCVGKNIDAFARITHQPLLPKLIHMQRYDFPRRANVFGNGLLAQWRDANRAILGCLPQTLRESQQAANNPLAAFS